MDYFDLLHKAQKNTREVNGQDVRCYSTSFSPPKKVQKSSVSSDNIQRFLARKEEEEKKKILEAKRKKEELLALRALDKKSQKRMQVMLKTTKSANKSVMEDAIDNVNTAHTLQGTQQCDEDDYGYVSQEASAFYEKLINKYSNTPNSNKDCKKEVKDLNAAKDRVKAALKRVEEEELNPTRKRKKKSEISENDKIPSDVDSDDDTDGNQKDPVPIKEEPKKEEKKKSVAKSGPPPVDFSQLLKLAEQKQFEPILIEKKAEKEPERPMTMKEKLEYQREMERKKRRANPNAYTNSSDNVPRKGSAALPISENKPTSFKIPKKTAKVSEEPKRSESVSAPQNTGKETGHSQGTTQPSKRPSSNSDQSSSKKPKLNLSTNSKLNSSQVQQSVPKSSSLSGKPKPQGSDNIKKPEKLEEKNKVLFGNEPKKQIQSKSGVPLNNKTQLKQTSSKAERKSSFDQLSDIDKEIELLKRKKAMMLKQAQLEKEKNTKEKVVPPKPIRTETEKPPIKKVESRPEAASSKTPVQQQRPLVKNTKMPDHRDLFPMKSKPRLKKPAKRVINSDSEYDSEMDDFIDDGPEDEMDYSKHIQEIFGYDKSRYRYANEDDEECMESSFAAQMFEERRSAKIGLMEDLEDIQREKEEKERAKMKKKSKMHR